MSQDKNKFQKVFNCWSFLKVKIVIKKKIEHVFNRIFSYSDDLNKMGRV